ncbi:hypothetical protein SNEBB_000230 [Seison nebaliae]|nr:hypothetical protein SNEBB_000230 [Seison nebaliae]
MQSPLTIMRQRKTQFFLSFFIFALIIYIVYHYPKVQQFNMVDGNFNLKSEFEENSCRLDGNILTLLNFYEKLKKEEKCKTIKNVFDRMYLKEMLSAEIFYPNNFEKKILSWFHDESFIQRLKVQKIVKLRNYFTNEEIIYNELRGLRPNSFKGQNDYEFVQERLKESAKSCDFCDDHYLTNTAEDNLKNYRRIKTTRSYTASNSFKYDKYHALIVSRHHDPLSLKLKDLEDMLALTQTWFNLVYEDNKDFVYPQAIWDAMPRSGASQIHTHLQSSVTHYSYYGTIEKQISAAWLYHKEVKSLLSKRQLIPANIYWRDLLLIHQSLGLVYQHKDTFALTYITPKKDREIIVMAENYNESFAELLYAVMRVMIEHLKVYSYSSAYILPPMNVDSKTFGKQLKNNMEKEKVHIRNGIPKMFWILFREPSNTTRSDFTGLELYTSSVLALDIFEINRKLHSNLKNYLD